jgi:hypothetical protein
VFDIKQASDGPVHFNIPPYVVPSDWSSYHAKSGQCYVQHKNHTGLLSLSPAGGVSYAEIIPPGIHVECFYSLNTSDDESELVTSDSSQPAIAPLEVREHGEVDMHLAYEGMPASCYNVAVQLMSMVALFQEHFNGAKEREDEDAEAVYQMLDYFPSYFQNKEAPVDSILTT